MKRVMTLILAVAVSLPVIAAAGSCDTTTVGPTFLKAFANPACLAKYGFSIPQ